MDWKRKKLQMAQEFANRPAARVSDDTQKRASLTDLGHKVGAQMRKALGM